MFDGFYYGVQINCEVQKDGTDKIFCEIMKRKDAIDPFDEGCIAVFLNEDLAKEYAEYCENGDDE